MGIRRVELQETLLGEGVEAPSIEAAEDASRRQKVSFWEALHASDQINAVSVSKALSALAGLPVLEVVDLEHLQHELVRTYPLSMARDRFPNDTFEIQKPRRKLTLAITRSLARDTLSNSAALQKYFLYFVIKTATGS